MNKQTRDLEQQNTNAKKAYQLQHGEQNRIMVQKCESSLAAQKKMTSELSVQMDQVVKELRQLSEKVEKVTRYRTLEQLFEEKEKKEREEKKKLTSQHVVSLSRLDADGDVRMMGVGLSQGLLSQGGPLANTALLADVEMGDASKLKISSDSYSAAHGPASTDWSRMETSSENTTPMGKKETPTNSTSSNNNNKKEHTTAISAISAISATAAAVEDAIAAEEDFM